MAKGYTLYEIPLFKRGKSNYWVNLQVVSIDDESFRIQTDHEVYAHRILTFQDEDFENTQGPIIIDLKPLDLERYYGETEIPTEFELPREILTERVEDRRLHALAKGSIWIDRSVDPMRYFYLECGRLRIKQGEKEATVDKINIIDGKNAVKVEALELGHPYLELQGPVARAFEDNRKVYQQFCIKLVFRGKSLLNGFDYYGLSGRLSKDNWSRVQTYFDDFGTEDKTLNGWLTRNPKVVAGTLGIPIEAGL